VRDVWPADQAAAHRGRSCSRARPSWQTGTLRLAEVTCHLGRNTLTPGSISPVAGEARLDLRDRRRRVRARRGRGLATCACSASLPWWEVLAAGQGRASPGRRALARAGWWRPQLRLDGGAGRPGPRRVSCASTASPRPCPAPPTSRSPARCGGTAGRPSLAASLSLTAEDTRALLGVAGVHLDGLLPGRSVRTLALTGALAASPARVAVRDLDLRLDGSRLTGSAAWVAGPRPRLALSGSLDRLDIGDYLPTGRFPDGGERFRDRLTAVDATVDLSVGRATLGELRGEGLYLRALLERGLLRLTELSVRDLAEAKLRLAGSGDLPVASFELAGELESARPARLLRALGLDAPRR
jgi:hypothetical protein